MFYNCIGVNYIKMLATDISASNCLYYWTYGVASTGTFIKHSNMTSLPTGSSGIPIGWTVVNDGEEIGGNLITFTVNGTEYQAEEGMTWREWINSDYNKYGFYELQMNPWFSNGSVVRNDSVSVDVTDVIINNHRYLISIGGGGQ